MNIRIWGALKNPNIQAHLRSIKSGSLVMGCTLEYSLALLRGFHCESWVLLPRAFTLQKTDTLISWMTEFSSRSPWWSQDKRLGFPTVHPVITTTSHLSVSPRFTWLPSTGLSVVLFSDPPFSTCTHCVSKLWAASPRVILTYPFPSYKR